MFRLTLKTSGVHYMDETSDYHFCTLLLNIVTCILIVLWLRFVNWRFCFYLGFRPVCVPFVSISLFFLSVYCVAAVGMTK